MQHQKAPAKCRNSRGASRGVLVTAAHRPDGVIDLRIRHFFFFFLKLASKVIITLLHSPRVVVKDLNEHVDWNLETHSSQSLCVLELQTPFPLRLLSRLWSSIKTIRKVPFAFDLYLHVGAGVPTVPQPSVPFDLFTVFA